MVTWIKRLGKWIIEHQWSVFIVIVLIAALTLTTISLWLYRTSGAIKLDLSRPGYEKVREDIKDDNDNAGPFLPTGNLDETAITDFRSRYETIKVRLNQINNYDNAVMSDENLGLVIGEAVTEPIE